MRYEIPEENEWLQPIENGYKFRCCDCGLVHDMDFRVRDLRAQFRARRNNRSTAQIRRHKDMGNDDFSRFLLLQIAEDNKESMTRLATE